MKPVFNSDDLMNPIFLVYQSMKGFPWGKLELDTCLRYVLNQLNDE